MEEGTEKTTVTKEVMEKWRAPKRMSVESLKKKVAKEVKKKEEKREVKQVAKGVEEGVGEYWEKVKIGFQVEVERYQESLRSLGERLKEVPEAQEAAREVQQSLASSMGDWVDVQRKILSATEAQTPEALRLPTPERLLEQGKFEEDAERQDVLEKGVESQVYQSEVENWFEDRLRNLESFGLAFEEQASLFSPLILAQTHFELDERTRELGEKMRRRLEARRKRQRLVRIWGVAGAESISNEGNAIDNSTLKELFTYTTKEGRKPIAEEFQNYEKMGVALSELKDRIEKTRDKKEKKKLEDERDDRIKAVVDYYGHGGYVDKESGRVVGADDLIADPVRRDNWVYLDEYLESQDKSESNREALEELEEALWARRFSGGLWSITLRAGKFGVALNGLGDIFVQRAIKPAEAFRARGLLRKTKGIWDPKEGAYAGETFEIGYTDFFTSVLASAKEQRRERGIPRNQLHKDWLSEQGIMEGEHFEADTYTDNEGNRIEKIVNVTSLATSHLGSEKFWDDLENTYGAGAKYGDHLFKFKQADETRLRFWGANSFFHNADLQSFLKLSESYGHVSENLITATAREEDKVEPIEITKNGVAVKVTEREQAWFDLLDRTLQWTKTDEAKEVTESLEYFPSAERNFWIEGVAAAEMITNEQRDYLLKKYLDFPLPGSAKAKARTRILVDNVIGVFRYPDTRELLLAGQLIEFIKRAFAYVFQEEGVRR